MRTKTAYASAYASIATAALSTAITLFFLIISLPSTVLAASPGSINTWAISLTSYLSSEEANRDAVPLRDAGYNAYITEADVKGKHYYRLRVGFYALKSEASRVASELSARFKVETPWVVKVRESEAVRYSRRDRIKDAPVTITPPVAAQPPAQQSPPGALTPDASGLLRINIFKDFHYVPSGWPMGLAAGQTKAVGLTTVPFEVFSRQPKYSSAKPLYGYLKLGNSADKVVSFVMDEVEKPNWIIYVDKNNNEDLTDDGGPMRNQGTGKMAAEVALNIDIVMPDNTAVKEPYNLWFFVNDSGTYFYAKCHWAGAVSVGGATYDAVAYEETSHDGLYKDSGVCIDLNRDQKCAKETELFKDGETITSGGKTYTVRLEYP